MPCTWPSAMSSAITLITRPRAVERDSTGLAVHLRGLERGSDLRALAPPGQQGAGHAGAAMESPGERGHLAPAVALQLHVVGEQGLEGTEVALLSGREEALRQLVALLPGRLEAGPPLLHVLPRPRG